MSVCLRSRTMTYMGRQFCLAVLRGKVYGFQQFSPLEGELNYSLSSLGVTELRFLKLRKETKYSVAVACLLNRLVDAKFRYRSKLLKSLLPLCFQVLYYWLRLKNNMKAAEHFCWVASIYNIYSIRPSSFSHIFCKIFHKKKARKYKFYVSVTSSEVFPFRASILQ